MFDNIGRKIKALAEILSWIGIVVFIIIGVLVATEFNAPGVGIAIAVVGFLVSWLSAFRLYGYGQLIENSEEIKLSLEELIEEKKKNQLNGDWGNTPIQTELPPQEPQASPLEKFLQAGKADKKTDKEASDDNSFSKED